MVATVLSTSSSLLETSLVSEIKESWFIFRCIIIKSERPVMLFIKHVARIAIVTKQYYKSDMQIKVKAVPTSYDWNIHVFVSKWKLILKIITAWFKHNEFHIFYNRLIILLKWVFFPPPPQCFIVMFMHMTSQGVALWMQVTCIYRT